MKTNTPRFFLYLSLYFLSYSGNAQLNFQVGYGLGFLSLPETKQLLKNYRDQNSWISSDFKDIKYINNFNVGTRYSFRALSFSLNWNYGMAKTKTNGNEPVSNSIFEKEIFIRLQTFSMNIESGGKSIQLGTGLTFNLLAIKEQQTGIDGKVMVSKEGQWGNEIYLNINFPSNSYSQISLRPYYFILWSGFDLSGLAKNLQTSSEPTNRKESFRHFGISLILSNGPQRE